MKGAVGTAAALILAALSGFGVVVARRQTQLGWLILPSLLALLLALCLPVWRSPGPRRALAALIGLSFGAVESSLLLSGLPNTVSAYFGLGPRRSLAAVLLLGSAHAMRHGLWALGVSEARARRVDFAWAASLGYVALAALWPRVGEDQLAAALVEIPGLRGLPALGGPQVSDFVLIASAAVVARYATRRLDALQPAHTQAEHWLLGIVGLCVAASAVVQLLVVRGSNAAPLRLAVVQPNRAPSDDDETRNDAVLLALSERALATAQADLVIGPESALAGRLSAHPEAELRKRLAPITRPHLVGADVRVPDDDAVYGSALWVSAKGTLVGRYDKKGLMPFAERFPLLWLIPNELIRRYQLPHAIPGVRPSTFTFGGARYGVLVCYEDLLPAHLFREFRGHVPDVFVSLVNDGWFGAGAVPRLHEAHARLRAVEWGRPLLRVTQTGVTAWFGPDGSRGATLVPERAISGVFVVPRAEGSTPFAWLGPWPGPAAWLALMGWALWRRLRPRDA